MTLPGLLNSISVAVSNIRFKVRYVILGTVRFKARYVLSVPFIGTVRGTVRLLNSFEVRYVNTVRLKF